MSKSAAIGILHGREETFPAAVLQEINGRDNSPGAESVLLGGIFPSADRQYRVILDRISHRIPFYRTFLRQQQSLGAICLPQLAAVQSLDRLSLAQIAQNQGIVVPRTVALPTKEHPPGVKGEDMVNLVYPLPWEKILEQVGFPCCFRSLSLEESWRVPIRSLRQLWEAYATTGDRLVVLQSCPPAEEHLFSLIIDDRVLTLSYHPEDGRYQTSTSFSPTLRQSIGEASLQVTRQCGLSMCGLEWSLVQGQLQLIDLHLCPNLDWWAVGEENFSNLVRATADLAIGLATQTKEKKPSLAGGSKKSAPGASKQSARQAGR